MPVKLAHVRMCAAMEARLAENEKALDACVRQYGGVSWESYRTLNPTANMLHAPPLPAGTVDAADFIKTVAEQERVEGIAKRARPV